MTRYFAYGANLDPVQMAERCPGARQVGRAEWRDHRFGIGRAGYGTAIPAAGEAIPGVLWELTPEDEAALDRFEGVPESLYRKDSARVHRSDGSSEPVMVYRATDPRPGRPAPGYLERIVVVAEVLEFPASYVAGLRGLLGPR